MKFIKIPFLLFLIFNVSNIMSAQTNRYIFSWNNAQITSGFSLIKFFKPGKTIEFNFQWRPVFFEEEKSTDLSQLVKKREVGSIICYLNQSDKIAYITSFECVKNDEKIKGLILKFLTNTFKDLGINALFVEVEEYIFQSLMLGVIYNSPELIELLLNANTNIFCDIYGKQLIEYAKDDPKVMKAVHRHVGKKISNATGLPKDVSDLISEFSVNEFNWPLF